MSRPLAAMNCWNSSTVTAFVDMAKGRLMATQCSGFSNNAAPLAASAEPCLNRPAASIVMTGQVGQSWITLPAFGTAATGRAATPTGTGAGGGARWDKNRATAN